MPRRLHRRRRPAVCRRPIRSRWTRKPCKRGPRPSTTWTGNKTIRRSHDNPDVQKLYKEYLGKPLSEKAHELLHTHYKANLPKGIISPELKIV